MNILKRNRFILFGLLFLAIGILVAKYGFLEKTQPALEMQSIELNDGDSYVLTASEVKKVIQEKEQDMLAYNGSVPGPAIHIKQGSTITLTLKNETDMPQMLHSHGVRMANEFDGSHLVQEEVAPGDSFTYTLTFPDTGVYWYHPHVHEVVGQALGLYGAFIVEPKNADYFSLVNKTETLFLSDIPTSRGTISINPEDNVLMGHYGNIILVNGSENYTLHANRGEVVRLYVINAANARPFNFVVQGAKMKLIGGDSGAYEKASFVNNVILSPSERAIVDVYFKESGEYAFLNKTPEITYELGKAIVADESTPDSYAASFNQLQSNAETITSIDPLRKYFNLEPEKRLRLTLAMSSGVGGHTISGGAHMMPDGSMMGNDTTQNNEGIEWEDTGMSMGNNDMAEWKIIDQDTGKENMDIHWDLVKDKPVMIEITNDKTSMHPMQHPIHFHGQRFLIVSRNGIKETNLVWKDTALVRSGETIRILLDPSNVGEWMAHCHISEHLANDMAFRFSVK